MVTLFFPTRLTPDRWLHHALALGTGMAIFSVLSLALFYFFYGASFACDEGKISQRIYSSKYSFPGELIGQGALSLRPLYALGWVARIADELSVLAYNSRPDQLLKETPIILSLRQGKEQQMITNGKTLYLKESETGKGLMVSSEPTSLWVKPILLDGVSALIEVGRKLTINGAQEVEEKGQFVANFQGAGPRYAFNPSLCVEVFRRAAAFSQDLVIQKYGGREFADWNQKIILQLEGSKGHYNLRVLPGDYFLYEDQEWRVVPAEELKEGVPIGQVMSASDKGVEIILWDAAGFSPWHAKIDLKKVQRPPFGAESMPAAVRLRTGTQVSANFGKRRLILKQGDWLIHGQTGWRHLRTQDELPLYLQGRLVGELFVFEAIDKDPQGKSVLKGVLFDETRTYMQPVNVPINIEKQQKSSHKRRTAQSRSIR